LWRKRGARKLTRNAYSAGLAIDFPTGSRKPEVRKPLRQSVFFRQTGFGFGAQK
jgi:hypothetical protein